LAFRPPVGRFAAPSGSGTALAFAATLGFAFPAAALAFGKGILLDLVSRVKASCDLGSTSRK